MVRFCSLIRVTDDMIQAARNETRQIMPSPGESGQAPELTLVRQLQEHLPVLDLHRKRARAAGVRRFGAAVFEADGPAVQRTGDAASEDDSLRQRPALVRAAVEQREAFAFGVPEHGDVAAGAADHAGAELGNVLGAADLDPARHAHRLAGFGRRFFHHTGSASVSYSRPSLLAARSFHASGSPSRACCSRAQSVLRLSASSTIFFLM